MDLFLYLRKYFYTQEELLVLSKVNLNNFQELEAIGVMPSCSYNLDIKILSNSFFGEHTDTSTVKYYAKGNLAWLGMLSSLSKPSDAFSIFNKRYQFEINRLMELGYYSDDPKVTSGLNQHVSEEWKYFLDGTYGLCTKSGLPEDIAAKELAILIINNYLNMEKLAKADLANLTRAVDLLDKVSSLFAPHERLKSSRHRLVTEVRRQFKLQNTPL